MPATTTSGSWDAFRRSALLAAGGEFSGTSRDWVRRQSGDSLEGKKILTYCTGGDSLREVQRVPP